jgi:hypothetical protein
MQAAGTALPFGALFRWRRAIMALKRKTHRTKSKTKKSRRRWSQRVTDESAALMLEPGVFTLRAPRQIALSLRRSAETSQSRKSSPFRSAMSMLTFFINRAGKGLSDSCRRRLEKAKDELRALYGKD